MSTSSGKCMYYIFQSLQDINYPHFNTDDFNIPSSTCNNSNCHPSTIITTIHSASANPSNIFQPFQDSAVSVLYVNLFKTTFLTIKKNKKMATRGNDPHCQSPKFSFSAPTLTGIASFLADAYSFHWNSRSSSQEYVTKTPQVTAQTHTDFPEKD